jgi:hypothetical protein
MMRRSALLVGIVAVSACDLSVTNPGPVPDSFLDEQVAHAAVVGGMSRALSSAVSWVGFTGAAVAREVTPSGGIGAFAYTVLVAAGELVPEERNAEWAQAHRARWVAEDGVRRMRRVLGEETFSTYELGARALLYAGYANRLLGENMCDAVIDSGPAEPIGMHFERAEVAFTEALAIANRIGNATVATAARAGRASVRAYLQKWADAETDARSIPAGFSFRANYATTSQEEYNRFSEANQNSPWRSHSVWNTYYEKYYETTRDPRTPWGFDANFPQGDGRPVPWYFELKYGRNRTAPINLSTQSEMKLILAEAALRSNDWRGALAIINELRVGSGVAPRTATTAEGAWTALKLERAIVLWLEARLLGDFRRWATERVPGQLPVEFDMSGRSLCFPISEAERATNPNLN